MLYLNELVRLAYNAFVGSLLGLLVAVVLSFLEFGLNQLALKLVPFYQVDYLPRFGLEGHMMAGVVLGALVAVVYVLRKLK